MLATPSERAFQTWVTKVAHLYGVCGFHISFSQGAVTGVHTLGLGDDHYDSNGFPDWIFITRDGRVLYRELKAFKGRLSADQRRWQAKLEAAGQDVGVWRPGDEQAVIAAFKGE